MAHRAERCSADFKGVATLGSFHQGSQKEFLQKDACYDRGDTFWLRDFPKARDAFSQNPSEPNSCFAICFVVYLLLVGHGIACREALSALPKTHATVL